MHSKAERQTRTRNGSKLYPQVKSKILFKVLRIMEINRDLKSKSICIKNK